MYPFSSQRQTLKSTYGDSLRISKCSTRLSGITITGISSHPTYKTKIVLKNVCKSNFFVSLAIIVKKIHPLTHYSYASQ